MWIAQHVATKESVGGLHLPLQGVFDIPASTVDALITPKQLGGKKVMGWLGGSGTCLRCSAEISVTYRLRI